MPRCECLTEDELTAFNLGNLSEAEAAAVAEHLEACEHCEALAARLDGKTDAVIAALRVHPPATDMSIRLSIARSSPSLTFTNFAANEPTKTKRISQPPPRMIGDYEILEEVGRGGMGVVYKARHTRLNRIVALKMVLGGDFADSGDLSRFVSEAEIVAQLAHPSIVQIYEVGLQQAQPFLALEFVDGPNLAERLCMRPFAPREAAALIELLARAVHHAHLQGIIHRDLKPANILLTADGAPKITDFGLAKNIAQGTKLTTTGTVLGTPAYMAPEQAQTGHGPIGIPADVHALGVILYELLAGAPPYQGDTPVETAVKVATMDPPPLSHRRPRLPRDLITICMRCLEKDPHRRYASAHALAADLRSFLNGDSIQARPAGQMERAWKWARKRPAVALLVAAMVAALVAGTAVSTFFGLAAHNRAFEAESARDRAAIAAANATAAEARAKGAQEEALRAKRMSDLRSAELMFRAGIADAESGFVDRGLYTMLNAARALPDDAVDFRRVLAGNLAAWSHRLPRLQVLANSTRGCFIGADGDKFALCGRDGLQFWDTLKARPSEIKHGPNLTGCVLASSSDGQVLLLEEDAGEAGCRLRRFATGEPIGPPLPGRGDQFLGFCFAPGDQLLRVERVFAPEPNGPAEFAFWDITSGKWVGPTLRSECHLLRDSRGKLVLMTAPLADGSFGDAAATAEFRDFATGENLSRVAVDSFGGDACARVGGGAIITVSLGSVVRWWDPASGKQRRQPWRPPSAAPNLTGKFTADGQRLLVRCTDQRLRWYEVATGRQCGPAVSLMGDVNIQMAMRPDGAAVLVTESFYKMTWLWRFDDLPPLPGNAIEPEARFTAAAYSPDRAAVATVSNRSAPQLRCGLLIDAATGRLKGPPMRDDACFPVFSADGRYLATCTAPTPDHVTNAFPVVRIWDAQTGEPTGKIFRPPNYVHGLQFAPEGHLLAVGCIGAIHLWDIDEPAPKPPLSFESAVSQLAFSPDGKWIAASSRSGWINEQARLGLWNVATGQRIGELVPVLHAPILCFSGDSRILHAFETSGRLGRWDVATMRPLHPVSPGDGVGSGITLQPHPNASRALFRPDGKYLTTGEVSGAARQWDVETGLPVGPPMSSTVPVTALAYRADSQVLAIGYADGATRLWDAPDVAAARTAARPTLRHYWAGIQQGWKQCAVNGKRRRDPDLAGATFRIVRRIEAVRRIDPQRGQGFARYLAGSNPWHPGRQRRDYVHPQRRLAAAV